MIPPAPSDRDDWIVSIAAAFAAKETSTPEDVIALVKGLRGLHPAQESVSASDTISTGDVSGGSSTAPGVGREAWAATERKPDHPPAVPIDQAVTDDMVFCLECGRGMRMLKRHLNQTHGLTPAEYRARWDLVDDWPLTARAYSALKSANAKKAGLGQPTARATSVQKGDAGGSAG